MRFGLRDLFWMTLVVVLALGWWLDRKTLEPYKSLWMDQQQNFQLKHPWNNAHLT